MDGKQRGAAHPQQQSQSVEHAVDRNGKIQRRQPQRTHPIGYEKGIRQIVYSQPQHTQHAHGRIPCKAARHTLFPRQIIHTLLPPFLFYLILLV